MTDNPADSPEHRVGMAIHGLNMAVDELLAIDRDPSLRKLLITDWPRILLILETIKYVKGQPS